MRRAQQIGFTLIELMVSIAILGIVLSIAIPSFSDFLEKKRLEGTANEYLGLLHFAKSETIKRNSATFIIATRASANDWSISATTTPTCTLNTACDLKTLNSTMAKSISANSDLTLLNGASIEARRLLPTFATTRSIIFSTDNYSLQANWTITGLNQLCIPTGANSFGGYAAC